MLKSLFSIFKPKTIKKEVIIYEIIQISNVKQTNLNALKIQKNNKNDLHKKKLLGKVKSCKIYNNEFSKLFKTPLLITLNEFDLHGNQLFESLFDKFDELLSKKRYTYKNKNDF